MSAASTVVVGPGVVSEVLTVRVCHAAARTPYPARSNPRSIEDMSTRPITSRSRRGRTTLLSVLFAAASLLVACGGDGAVDGPVSLPGGAIPVDDPFSGGYPTYDDAASGLRIVFGTPDLGAGGASRVSFALYDGAGPLAIPTLGVTTRYYPDGPEGEYERVEETEVTFRRFPEDSRGIYTGDLRFERAGLWALDVAVPGPGGAPLQVVFPVEVAEESTAPPIGGAAPASSNRTSADVDDLDDLTTATEPDPRLYETKIASALEAGTPFVLTFASPAFCTNALCGPQVEVLSALADDYGDGVAFIHVELYENPAELRGDFSLARRTPVLEEWGIHTDEWTFVVDRDGIVTARFEGFAPREEVETALLATIEG